MFTLLVGLQSAWEAVTKMNFEEKNILGSIILNVFFNLRRDLNFMTCYIYEM